jgi:deazaflavin-dependent oxidoreductase (nitroreductase family)
LAGYAPWWLLLETTGRRTGKRRLTPFANGPMDADALWFVAVHGEASAFAKNIKAHPEVRVKRRGRWHAGTATLVEPFPEIVDRLNRYARAGLERLGEEPKLVKVTLR